jgi:hypothetical protein
MPRCFSISTAVIHKRNDTLTQLDRMRLAHGASSSMATVNHRSAKPESRILLAATRLTLRCLMPGKDDMFCDWIICVNWRYAPIC